MNERKRKRQTFFKRITREMAIKEIKDLEFKLGRKVTNKERHEIIHKVATKAKIRATSLLLALSMGFSAGLLVAGNEPKKEEPLFEDEVKTALKAEEDQILKETTRNSFVEQLKFEGQAEQGKHMKEEQINTEIAKQNELIDQMENSEDLLTWFKNLYANAYKNKTGKEIDASNLKFVKSENTYLYKDGNHYITHGSYPQITENKIGNNVETVSETQPFEIYTIYEKDGTDYKVLDSMTYKTVKGQKVAITITSGDTYIKNKDYNSVSVIADMGKIPEVVIEIDDLYNQPSNPYINSKIDSSKTKLKEEMNIGSNNKTGESLIQADDEWELT